MRQILCATAAVGIMLVCAPSLGWAANLVSDGGFENPLVANSTSCGATYCAGFTVGQTIGPWTVVGPGQTAGNFAILNISRPYAEGTLKFEPARGNQALDLTGSSNQGLNGVQETIKTKPGVTYTVSFSIGHADRDAYLPASMVSLFINGVSVGNFTNDLVTANRINWAQSSYSFTATGKSTVIAFYNASTDSNDVGLDQVSVAPAVVVSGADLGKGMR